MNHLAVLKNMLKDFSVIKSTEPVHPTFMEISGYPHLENVCSNILSFFLTAGECHDLGDILLRSLFLAADYEFEDSPFQDVLVERETCTDARKRIDIVVETDRFVVGIENKIFSGLGNDLKHYAEHIRQRAKDKQTVLILLTLLPVKVTDLGNMHYFRPITYGQWFSNIQMLLGQYALECDHKYLLYLLDFMKTVERLGHGPEMNNELITFLAENKESVNRLMSEVKSVRAELRREATRLADFVQYDETIGIRQWVWTSTDDILSALVHDLPFMGTRQLAVDTYLAPDGWRIRIFTRKQGSEDLVEWLRQRGIEFEKLDSNGRYVDYKLFPYGSDKAQIAAVLSELLVKLSVTPVETK